MRSVSISVTEAARNFADCINRARYQGTTFILHKNGVVVARIVPESRGSGEPEPEGKTATKATLSEPIVSGGDLKPVGKPPIPDIW